MTATAVVAPIAPPPLEPGAEIAARYRVVELLSRGNDLDVYDVWSEDLQARCVIKTLRPDRLDRPRLVERLAFEGNILTTLHHPHLVRGYEVLEVPRPLVVMETITGYTLEGLLLHKRARLPLVDLVNLGEHLCSALQFLHRREILHLDLKPKNVVSEAGKAKIIDFSLAHAPGRGPAGWGTPAYMAPEQARGDEFTTACDVWALGLILYEAASGVQPFDEPGGSDDETASESSTSTDSDRVYHQLTVRADPLRALRRLPTALSSIIDRCLEPLAPERPAVMDVFAAMRAIQNR